MKPSESKHKMNIKDICREYYESQIFSGHDWKADSEGKSLGCASSAEFFFIDSSIELQVADGSFKEMDSLTFDKEMQAINIELFGLLLLNHNQKLYDEGSLPSNSPESYLSEEIVFTKKYLNDNDRGDIWEKMKFCNTSIMQTLGDEIASKNYGYLRGFPKLTVVDRSFDDEKKELIDKCKLVIDAFQKQVQDADCLNRLVSRYMFVPCNVPRITALSQKLALKLPERLLICPSQTGLFALQKLLVVLYDNAVNYLVAVLEHGSYQVAKEAQNKLLTMLKNYALKELRKSTPSH
ncbi:hypothetical protein ACFLXL_02925 [Chloroflexota bacterium]